MNGSATTDMLSINYKENKVKEPILKSMGTNRETTDTEIDTQNLDLTKPIESEEVENPINDNSQKKDKKTLVPVNGDNIEGLLPKNHTTIKDRESISQLEANVETNIIENEIGTKGSEDQHLNLDHEEFIESDLVDNMQDNDADENVTINTS